MLRCSWFAQNFSEDYLLDPILAGQVLLPAGDVGEPFIDAEDIADVAVAALTEEGHTGRTHELTGPRLLTFANAVSEIAAATGRPIGYTQVSAADYAAALHEYGVPLEVVELLTYLFATVLDGRNAVLGNGVQRVMGRPARDFTEYARDAAKAGAWNRKFA